MSQQAQGSGSSNLLVVIATALVAFAGGYLIGNKTAGPGAGTEEAVQGAAQIPTGGIAGDSDVIPIGTSPVLGSATAPITIIEFSDFQCPFCSRGGDTAKQLVEKYPNDVRVVFKHNPLPFHAQAPDASKAAMAAGEQGKFWEMHDILFKNQKEMKDANMKEMTSGFAKQIGIDVAKFQKDFADPKFDQVIKDDMALGSKLGVRGTPHFFINGERLSGAQPIDKFEAIIKAQLEEAKKMIGSGTAKDQIYAKMVSQNFKAEAEQPQQKQAAPATVVEMVPVRANDPVKGNAKDYVVTIVEFSDFECPFCSRVNPTMAEVMKNFGDKVRVVFKQNPLPFHAQAPGAAEASLAANEQGKFWEMHGLLFENQQAFKGANMNELTTGYAQKLGLNVNKFKAYLEGGKGKAIIKEDMDLAAKVGARGTPNFFVNGVQLVGAKPYPAFEAVIKEQIALAEKLQKSNNLKGDALYAAVVAENKKNAPAAAAAPAQAPPEEAKVDLKLLTQGASYAKGPKNAPITIYEFSDFQCPYCSRGNTTLMEAAKAYDGKVQVVFKAFPLPFHAEAEPAHRAALAAGKQGKFWEMHDKFFGAQARLKEPGIVDTYAKEIGLNLEKFKVDFESDELKKQVQAEAEEGKAVGVRGTPAFFINGTRLVGAQPLEKFKEVIEAELKAKK
jgi:protein-disulfide isomerase